MGEAISPHPSGIGAARKGGRGRGEEEQREKEGRGGKVRVEGKGRRRERGRGGEERVNVQHAGYPVHSFSLSSASSLPLWESSTIFHHLDSQLTSDDSLSPETLTLGSASVPQIKCLVIDSLSLKP